MELNTSNKKLFKLDFDRSPQPIYSPSNIKVISNLKLKSSRLEKVSIKWKLTWGCFVKNFLFDSLFLLNLKFSLRIFYILWNIPFKALYSWKVGVSNGSQKMWDSFQILVFNAKNLPFIGFWNPSHICRFVPAYAGRGFPWSFIFQK